MARRSAIEILEKEIIHRIDADSRRVFAVMEFREVYQNLSTNFAFPQSLTFKAFCEYFEKRELLTMKTLEFPWRTFTRYVWKEGISDIQVISTLDTSGYFSHFTAARLMGLTIENPKSIYFNVEQSAKPPGTGLNQSTIDRAFKGKPRLSKQIAKLGNQEVYYLSGKNTDNLGVITTEDGIRHTDIERTLFDIAVRPAYCGGIDQVFRIYQTASEFDFVVSVNKLRSYIQKIKHVYPYQQAVGYLLDAAGFKSPILSVLQGDRSEFNFYLDYGIRDAVLDTKWKIFIPKHFPLTA